MSQKANVSTPSPSYLAQEEWRALPRLLMEGTRALRRTDNAAVYLPPEDDEEWRSGDTGPRPGGGKGASEWEQRISRSVIVPFFERAVRRAVAAIFAKPVVLDARDVPKEIRGTRDDHRDGWWENVDLEGNDGNVFFSRVAEDALGDAGVSWVLVEHQPVTAGATMADLASQGLRPYLVHVRAQQVIDEQYEAVAGRRRLKLVRIKETYEEDGETEWERKCGEQIRVLRVAAAVLTNAEEEDGEEGSNANPGGFVRWETYRQPDAKNKPDDWVLHESGLMQPHVDIPMVPYYTGYLALGKARTPFDDLAHLNMLHTQKLSDVGEGFRISLGAQLHRSGISVDDAMKQRAIGVKRLLVSENPEASAEWLERTGSAAKVAMEDLDRLEARMLALANEPHVRRTGTETATGRAIDSAEAKTETQKWSLAMRDHIERVLTFFAAYRGHQTGGSVEMKMPPRHSEQDIEALKLMVEMHVKTGGAPRIQTILEEMQRQGRLPDDLDVEQEAAAVEDQALTAGPEGRTRSVVRALAQRGGMAPEEIDALLDGAEDGEVAA